MPGSSAHYGGAARMHASPQHGVLDGWNRMLVPPGCFLKRVLSTADFARAPGEARIGLILGFQDSDHFRQVSDVEGFYRLGQRVSQLTYNTRNSLGYGCFESRDRGLTPFGAAVVAKMNELGMAVDVSHCGDRTSLDAFMSRSSQCS